MGCGCTPIIGWAGGGPPPLKLSIKDHSWFGAGTCSLACHVFQFWLMFRCYKDRYVTQGVLPFYNPVGTGVVNGATCETSGTQVSRSRWRCDGTSRVRTLDPKLHAIGSVRRRRVRCTQKAEPYCTMTISASTQTMLARSTLHNRSVGLRSDDLQIHEL